MAVNHIVSSLRPVSLRTRLQSDLDFTKHCLKKDFKGFRAHAVRLSEAFELLDNGPKSHDTKTDSDTKPSGPSGSKPKKEPKAVKSDPNKARSDPPCPYGPCKEKNLRHCIKDCPASNDAEKSRMRAGLAANRAGKKEENRRRVAGRLRNKPAAPKTADKVPHPFCAMNLSDGVHTHEVEGRCDDGCDDSITSSTAAEAAVGKGIGKMVSIAPMRLQVPLKRGQDDKAQTFTFSHTWTAPRTIMHLSSGQLALSNVKFLVSDDALVSEDLLIGLPVLEHLQVETRTLLERNRSALDGADCFEVASPMIDERSGTVSRMMISRLNRSVNTEESDERQSFVHFNSVRSERAPFPDPSLLDPIDSEQHGEIEAAVASMKDNAMKNGLSTDQANTLNRTVDEFVNIFRT